MSSTTRQDIAAVTDDTFASEVLGSSTPVLVEYWAEWCGPCKMLSPVLAELAAEHGDRLRVVKMDTDMNPKTAASQRIMGVPTMTLYRDGEAVATLVGARSKAAVWQAFEQHV
ncbi:MAG TPA: thioredoxin [Pseudonocardiaceae bacterium]|jgi:thioredoxin 1|nr:thioredoxin [Pseudonocardiaceae bacterium]